VLLIGTTILALSLSNFADAAKRPTTFVVDTRLSEGPAENFSELFVDSYKLSGLLKPLDANQSISPRAIVTNDRIAINDRIFFAPGSNNIRPSSFPILDQVANTLLSRPDIEEVSIQGHAARNANGDVNLALSVRQAKAVVDYLVSKGVKAERIASIGFGQSRPMGETDANDRVEFVIEKWSKKRSSDSSAPIVPSNKSNGTGSLLIENDRSYEAEVAVNGTVIGTVGPYTDAVIHGLKEGLYDLRFTHTTGYSYYNAVRTSVVNSPIVPGGKGAAAVLPNGGQPAKTTAE
jgi:outer membrane protein OmpA-like peptidoglycan-associated protein